MPILDADRSVIGIDGLSHQLDLWSEETCDLSVAMVGPLGCGKTFGLAVKQALLRVSNRGVDGLLVVPSYPIARKVHFKDWPEIWKSIGIRVVHEKANNAWLWPWGDRTWIGTADEPASLVGPNLADVTFDEPGLMVREAFDRASARARHPKARVRQKVLGGTPEGINWFADLFAEPSAGFRTIFARTWHATMAHYPQQLKDLYGYDESLLAAYVRGKFVPLRVGRCYKPFDRAAHVAKLPLKHEPGLPLLLGCDFNVDTMRWVVGQVTPREILILDEIALGKGSSTADASKEFVRRWAGKHKGHVVVTGDASGKARSTSGKTDYQVIAEEMRGPFRELTFDVAGANPRQKDRIDLMNYHLSGRGRRVLVSKSCRELPLDWERVVWKKGTPEIDKNIDLDRGHASDAADYLVWQRARALSVPTRAAVVGGSSGAGVATMEY